MISAIMKCNILDDEILQMTKNAINTVKPYVDELVLVTKGIGEIDKDCKHVHTLDIGFPNFVTVGMENTKGDKVAILNNDILFKGNWVTPLLKLFDDDTLLVHPNMVEWDQEFDEGKKVLMNINPRYGMYFSAFILNRNLYFPWDTDYDFWGYDDYDYYYRARKKGLNCIWTDRVCYKHKGGATISKIGRKQFEDKNREIFIKKHRIDPDFIDWSKL